MKHYLLYAHYALPYPLVALFKPLLFGYLEYLLLELVR